jgi:hypothetical protein
MRVCRTWAGSAWWCSDVGRGKRPDRTFADRAWSCTARARSANVPDALHRKLKARAAGHAAHTRRDAGQLHSRSRGACAVEAPLSRPDELQGLHLVDLDPMRPPSFVIGPPSWLGTPLGNPHQRADPKQLQRNSPHEGRRTAPSDDNAGASGVNVRGRQRDQK